jgi:hypothetical protein
MGFLRVNLPKKWATSFPGTKSLPKIFVVTKCKSCLCEFIKSSFWNKVLLLWSTAKVYYWAISVLSLLVEWWFVDTYYFFFKYTPIFLLLWYI